MWKINVYSIIQLQVIGTICVNFHLLTLNVGFLFYFLTNLIICIFISYLYFFISYKTYFDILKARGKNKMIYISTLAKDFHIVS